jgi:hypothetical protein
MFSVILTLWGVLSFFDLPSVEALGLPGWYYALQFCFSLGFIVLGILSWKRARCFRSTGRAFLYLLARIVTIILALVISMGPEAVFEEPMPDATSGMLNAVALVWAFFGCIFFGVTILLTLANKDKSANTTSLTFAGKDKSANTASLTFAGKDRSANTASLTLANKDRTAVTAFLTLANKDMPAERLAHQHEGRYVINPRNFRRDLALMGALVGFWLLLIPLAAGLTHLVYTDPHPAIYLGFALAYLAIIIVSVSLYTMNKEQILEVKGNSLVVNRTTIIPPYKVRIDKLNLQALTLERDPRVPDSSIPVYTLNLIQKGALRPKRILLASYVPFYDRAILFEEIKEFLQKNGFKFETRNEMANSVTTEWMLPQKGRSAKRRVVI